MRSASTDPCLFHATLFSASAHLDGLQGITDNPRTIFHQLQAVRLLSERLRQPHFRVNYATIGAVLGLGYFDMVIKNVDGVLAHNHGLMQMLATNHDQGPETEFLMGLANETHFILSMVNNTDALFLPHPNTPEQTIQHPVHPLAGICPARILYRILGRAATGSRHVQASMNVLSPDTVLDLINAACMVTQHAGLTESSTDESRRTTTTAATTTTAPSTTIRSLGTEALKRACSLSPSSRAELGPVTKAMNKCIQLATKLCRNILLLSSTLINSASSTALSPSPTSPISTPTTPLPPPPRAMATTSYIAASCFREDIETLKTTLPKIDFVTWLQHAPEAYAWVCFTAAAAAAAASASATSSSDGGNETDDWSSFILTPMPVITARDSADLCVLREGWAYLRWLRGVVDVGMIGVV
ncbi:hypothetical protein HK57_00229 [Aspergillus ustus]|uniref:Uncharacterized protein n=1 Tax=Aspergillus ustus TaxID=40382 RepID=A0A0C1E771_ASPUT|nr:hypothetical protein HK57_00229 [Aspergillus ustus]